MAGVLDNLLEPKKLYQNISFVGTCTLAFTIPWILFRTLKAIYIKRRYNQLFGKVVLITGASSGLGEALAHEFYKLGCQVVLCARRRQELDRVKQEILKTHSVPATNPPIIIPLDLSDINTLPDAVQKVISITGQIDILVNNGGISSRGFILDTKPDVDIKVMLVNYFGSVALTKAALPHMIKRREGQIVFVSSIQGLIALPERSAYSASKHAMQAFGDSLRAEMAEYNIGVTMVSPGYIKTALSLNAVTGSGATYGQMDSTTQQGYSPEYVSKEIVKAVAQKRKELVISTLIPRIAIFLRKYIPMVYFFVMARRAKKSRLAT